MYRARRRAYGQVSQHRFAGHCRHFTRQDEVGEDALLEPLVAAGIAEGAGPVGSLAALYAAVRGYEVDVYELRAGKA